MLTRIIRYTNEVNRLQCLIVHIAFPSPVPAVTSAQVWTWPPLLVPITFRYRWCLRRPRTLIFTKTKKQKISLWTLTLFQTTRNAIIRVVSDNTERWPWWRTVLQASVLTQCFSLPSPHSFAEGHSLYIPSTIHILYCSVERVLRSSCSGQFVTVLWSFTTAVSIYVLYATQNNRPPSEKNTVAEKESGEGTVSYDLCAKCTSSKETSTSMESTFCSKCTF